MTKAIMRRCPEDSSMCFPAEGYCDGIPHCLDGGDEILPTCTCEDWGLKSCKTEDNKHNKCLNTYWAQEKIHHNLTFECHALFYTMNDSIELTEKIMPGMFA